jgi:hypothetical protein
MKKKKIIILLLAFILLVSTTGLPVSYHLCKMMETKSLSECGVCANYEDEILYSCCLKGTLENKVSIASENMICCQEEFVYNKIDDEFVNNKTDVNYFSSIEILFQSTVLIPHSFDFSLEESFYCDSSPPFLINPELYISNSILLI